MAVRDDRSDVKQTTWKHSGFSVDNTVGVGANDPQGRRQLIGR